MISISLSPNTQIDDIVLAFKQILAFVTWGKSASSIELEKEFARNLKVPAAFSFNSGRSCLVAILEAFCIGEGDEVLLQAFTCNAVPNPVLWRGAVPVYVDCLKEDFNMDPKDLEAKITPKSRAVVVQHTFGIPADMERISQICSDRKLLLIEDAAHALGAEYMGQPIGTFGDAAFFSFSRDKVISSVYGGIAVVKSPETAKALKKIHDSTPLPSFFWTFQQLLHPLLVNLLILPFYGLWGKYLLVLFQQMGLLSKAVHAKEKQGQKPSYFTKRLPEPLARLALLQLSKLREMREHRERLVAFYEEKLKDTSFVLPENFEERRPSHLRLPVRHKKAHDIIREARKQNLLLGDWYTSPVAPDDTNTSKLLYEEGSCPTAEALSRETINLPTHVRCSLKNAETVVAFLKRYDD